MPIKLTQHLRDLIVTEFALGHTNAAIASKHGISTSQVWKMRRNYTYYGDTQAPCISRRGRPPLLTKSQEDALLQYLNNRPDAYLDEMCWFIFDEFNIIIAESTLSQVLARRRWTRKAVCLNFI
jgi:transposase